MYTLGTHTVKDKQKAEHAVHMFLIDRYFSPKTSSVNTVLYNIWTVKKWEGRKKQTNKKAYYKIVKNVNGTMMLNKEYR